MTVCGRFGTLLAAGMLLAVLGTGCGKNKFEKEGEAEAQSVKLARDTAAGGYELVTAAELKSLLDEKTDLVLVDAMPLEESYKKEHIPGAVQFLFPVKTMQDWDTGETAGKSAEDYGGLLGSDKDKLVVTYCGFVKCGRSHNAALWARRLGYAKVKRFPGGIFAWKGAGFPLESGE